MWHVPVITNGTILANSPGIVLLDERENSYLLIDIAKYLPTLIDITKADDSKLTQKELKK